MYACMHAGKGFIVPPCPNCGGLLKPDVVFFGDGVPAERSKRCVPSWSVAQAPCYTAAARLLCLSRRGADLHIWDALVAA